MVALSIVFSYGLQFCVPSEIAWAWLEPRLRDRGRIPAAAAGHLADGKGPPPEPAAAKSEPPVPDTRPVGLPYYAMRATMILITCKSRSLHAQPVRITASTRALSVHSPDRRDRPKPGARHLPIRRHLLLRAGPILSGRHPFGHVLGPRGRRRGRRGRPPGTGHRQRRVRRRRGPADATPATLCPQA